MEILDMIKNQEHLPPLNDKIIASAQEWVRKNKGNKVTEKSAYGSPRLNSEIMDCALPLTFDQYNYCGLGCQYCVLEGTQIATPNGKTPIEKIHTGDIVYSRNTKSNHVEEDVVTSTMERNVSELLEIELEDGTLLNVTKEHPIWINGYGWKPAGELQKCDEIDFAKRPDVSFHYSNGKNPMQRTNIAKKMSQTLKARYASGELDGLRKMFAKIGRKNLIAYNKLPSTREAVSNRMKKNNPMHNPETAAKVGETRKHLYKQGILVPPARGKPRPDVAERMSSEANPMKNPTIRRLTLQKIVRSWKKNGRISQGENKVLEALRGLKLNFIHQAVISGPKRNYILDFMLPDYSICIEYDGHSNHYTNKGIADSIQRDKWVLKHYGIQTVHIHRDEAFIPMESLQSIIVKKGNLE